MTSDGEEWFFAPARRNQREDAQDNQCAHSEKRAVPRTTQKNRRFHDMMFDDLSREEK